ncbi:MAG: S26 family signal peptidase, partial [Bacteroides sp.]|nr:S26 family signal peptidase [Bacteroides sp.]
MKSNPYITQWINRIINILFTIAVIGVIYVLVQLFLIASFTIPSNSMEPELMKGDRIWVWKPAIGARLFN